MHRASHTQRQWMLDLHHLEIFLAGPAFGADPVHRHIGPGRSGRQAVVGVTGRLVINPAADQAHPGLTIAQGVQLTIDERIIGDSRLPRRTSDSGKRRKLSATYCYEPHAKDRFPCQPLLPEPIPTAAPAIAQINPRVSTMTKDCTDRLWQKSMSVWAHTQDFSETARGSCRPGSTVPRRSGEHNPTLHEHHSYPLEPHRRSH